MLPFTKRFLREYLPGTGRWYFGGLTFLLITVVATTTIPLWVKRAVAILKNSSDGLADDQRQALLVAGWAIILLGLVLALCRSLSRILIFIPGRRVEARLRRAYYDAAVVLPAHRAAEFTTGDLISRGISDVSASRVLLSMGVLHIVNSSLLLMFCLYHLLSMSPLLTLICVLPAPLMQLAIRHFSKSMIHQARAVQTQLGQLSEKIRETFRAHMLITIYPVYDQMIARFMSTNDAYRNASEEYMRGRVYLFTMIASLGGLAKVILLMVGGRMALGDSARLSVEEFVAFGSYITLIQDPLRLGGFLMSMFQRGEAALERIYGVRDAADEYRAAQADRNVASTQALHAHENGTDVSIAVTNLAYAYPANGSANGTTYARGFALSIPSLEIRRGRRYGFFGPVGCGKSTLLNILNGSLAVPRGMCTFHGVDYNDVTDETLAREFSIAPQESRHFAMSIRENIDQVVRHAAQPSDAHHALAFEQAYTVSQLEPDLAEFNDGLDTLLGENGINLSGGQKQRLSILRALVKPHRILMLDDVLSSVDHHTEAAILQHLYANLEPGDSVIFVSHRISALIPCDEILIMDQGQIVQRGTHAELLASHAVYRRTYKHQIIEQQIEELSHGQ
jgi:ATP-binding cassette subfamily B protein